MKKLLNIDTGLILLCIVFLAMIGLSGCYVGRAEFRGEDMRVYPLFHSRHAATDCQDGTCSEAQNK